MFSRSKSAVVLITQLALLGYCAGCKDSTPKVIIEQPTVLTILTPHNADIRHEFTREFSKWYDKEHNKFVTIQWESRGTPECVNLIRDINEGSSRSARRIKPDLLFGGGISYHAAIAADGFAQPVMMENSGGRIPEQVAGQPTRDKDGQWYGIALASFGITYNQDACDKREIAPPKTWSDLADPRFFGWTAVTDPAKSGSHRRSMMLILDAQGWLAGWSTIIRTLANARALQDSSTDALHQVNSGACLASYSINFDGMSLADQSKGMVRYINPPGATAASVDCMTILKGSKHSEIAREFVRFVLSDLGQSLWGVDPDHLGTSGYPLFHYPLSPKTYETHAGHMLFDENPLTKDFGLEIDLNAAKQRSELIQMMVQAAAGDNHILLQRAWGAVIRRGMNQNALRELTTPPFPEAEALAAVDSLKDASKRDRKAKIDEWSRIFRSKYERVLELTAQ